MNILQLSNLFNTIALAIGAKWYHFGAAADVNRNIENNYDPAAALGKQYPAILFEYPVGRWLWQSRPREQQFDIIVNFYDLFGRDNAGVADGLTEAEKFATLDVLVSKFFDLFRTLGKLQLSGGAGLAGTEIGLEYIPFAHNDALLQIQARFSVTLTRECTTPDFTDAETVQAILATLPPEYELPPTGGDYEKIK